MEILYYKRGKYCLLRSTLTALFIMIITIMNFEYVYGEDKEEIMYFSLEENPEITKQKASDAFWENPLDTPPFLILLGLIAIPIFVAWKRKWHIHEKQNKQEK